jgi:ethanolamine transporter EutH
VRWQIWLPVVLLMLLFIGVLAVVLVLPQREQVSIIADFMVTLLVVCPLSLLCLVVAVGLLFAVAAMSKSFRLVQRPLHRVQGLSETMATRTAKMSDTVNHKAIDASARFAPVYKALGVFERGSTTKEGDARRE